MTTLEGKKILFVITKSNWGGAQSYVYSLATKFQEMGALVTVALGGTGLPGSPTGILASKLQEAGVATILVKSFTRDVSLSREISALTEIREIIRRERPNIIHLNSSKAGGIGALAARIEKVPQILFTVHGWAHREPRGILGRTFIWISSWITVLLCTSVIVVSKRDYLDSPVIFSRKKIHLIRNGISEFSLLDKAAARSTLNPSLGITDTVLLMQAELHGNKGIDIAKSVSLCPWRRRRAYNSIESYRQIKTLRESVLARFCS
jgi:hypothetical protein